MASARGRSLARASSSRTSSRTIGHGAFARQVRRVIRRRDQQIERRILDHELEALPRVVGVERHERAGRLQRPEDRDDHVDRAIDRDPDPPFTAEPARPQQPGEAVGLAVEPAIRERARGVRHGHRVRLTRRHLLDEPVQRRGPAVRDRGPVPFVDDLTALLVAEHRDVAEPGGAGAAQRPQHRGEVVELGLEGAGGERARIERQPERQLLAREDDEQEREVGLLDDAEIADAQVRDLRLAPRVERIVLEHHEGVEQVGAAAADRSTPGSRRAACTRTTAPGPSALAARGAIRPAPVPRRRWRGSAGR